MGDTPLTLLLAAQAGRQSGHDDEAAAAYRLLADRRDAPFLGLRGLLRQAIADENWDEADSLARRAEAAYPGAQWLKDERRSLACDAWGTPGKIAWVEPDEHGTLLPPGGQRQFPRLTAAQDIESIG